MIALEKNGGDKYGSLRDASFVRKHEEAFVKLIEVVNRFRRRIRTGVLPRRPASSSNGIDVRSYSIENVDALLNGWREANFPLYSQEPHSRYPAEMLITVEFVEWLIANVVELSSRQAAVDFANTLIKADRLRMLQTVESENDDLDSSVSNDSHCREFRYGFFLCYFVDELFVEDSWSRAVQCEIGKRCLGVAPADCPYRLSSVEMNFQIQTHKATDSVIRDYLPPHVTQYLEWGRVFFERTYIVTKSFEIGVRWFMANSQTVAENVRQWCSKAANLAFHMFPVPEDPFSDSFNTHSPPLRCPIIIPFKSELFPQQEIWKLITVIMDVFGFIEMGCSIHASPQYVHLTGGMFLMYDEKREAFAWSWNHMLSHRYRGNTSCSEDFQDYMLYDFRSFCSNSNNRVDKLIDNIIVHGAIE